MVVVMGGGRGRGWKEREQRQVRSVCRTTMARQVQEAQQNALQQRTGPEDRGVGSKRKAQCLLTLFCSKDSHKEDATALCRVRLECFQAPDVVEREEMGEGGGGERESGFDRRMN